MSSKTVIVVGAGTMGAGIAQVSALAGYTTYLNDLDQDLLKTALNKIHASIDKGVAKGKTDENVAVAAKERLSITSNIDEVIGSADLLIEAVPEKMDLKKKLFSDWVAKASGTCLFATNTSSLSVTEIAAATGAPDRVCGMHFFNPPPILKLLEIVTHEKLSDDTLRQVRDYADAMERKSIVVKDSPGFASSRLAVATAMEAIRMLEEGVASAADIDTALEVGYRHPMGPLKLTDHIGLDVRLDITSYLYEKLGTETFKPPELLKKLVAEGKCGKKSGQGFYIWDDEGKAHASTA